MNPFTLPANAPIVYLKAFTDSDSLYKQIVCLVDWNLSNNADSTVTDTLHCGPLTAVIVPKFTCSFNAVFDTNTDPALEVSAQGLQNYMTNATRCAVKIEYPTATSAGTTYYRQGACFVTKVDEISTAKDNLKYSVTLTGDGILDVTY